MTPSALREILNQIQTKIKKSIYKVFDVPYYDIYIDGITIDDFLDERNPMKNLKGLVPTTSGWFLDEKDEEIVWERILPVENGKTLCPILICPDDQDYYCTTIVVEIENKLGKIFWNRFGFNKKYEFRNYDTIGKEVDWLKNTEVLEFDKDEYKKIVNLIKENKKSET